MIKVSFGKKLGTLGILVWAEWLKISGEKKGAQGILLKWDGKRVKREEMLSAACSKIIKIFLWSWAQRTPPGIWVHVFSGSWVKILESLTASLPVRCGDTVLTFKDVAFQACLFGGTLVGVAIDTKNHHYIHPSICMFIYDIQFLTDAYRNEIGWFLGTPNLAKGHVEHGRKEGDLGASLEETVWLFWRSPPFFLERFFPILLDVF